MLKNYFPNFGLRQINSLLRVNLKKHRLQQPDSVLQQTDELLYVSSYLNNEPVGMTQFYSSQT